MVNGNYELVLVDPCPSNESMVGYVDINYVKLVGVSTAKSSIMTLELMSTRAR